MKVAIIDKIEHDFPDIAEKYFDLKWQQFSRSMCFSSKYLDSRFKNINILIWTENMEKFKFKYEKMRFENVC